jgi:threonine synthase
MIESIQVLAETEGIFTETAGGVTAGCARKLYRSGRITPEETTVLCITGNGLKTTDVLSGKYEVEEPIRPKVAEFERLLQRTLETAEFPETVEA